MPRRNIWWEMHIVREAEQHNRREGRRRTVGRYQVHHDGEEQTGTTLAAKMTRTKRRPVACSSFWKASG
jgi:hypothetical protein